jgi:hypothetical protein
LFNLAKIGRTNSAKSALNALKTLIAYPDEEARMLGLKKLSESMVFSILVASSRVCAASDFQEVRKYFQDNSITIVEPYLRAAMYSDDLERPQKVSNKLEAMRLFTPFHHIWYTKHGASQFPVRERYCCLISEYIQCPSIVIGYVITNALEFGDDMTSLVRLLSVTDEHSRKLLNDMPIEEITTLLTFIPSQIDDTRLFETTLSFPSISRRLPDICLSKISSGHRETVIIIANQILEQYEDFGLLLIISGSFIPFLQSIAVLIPTIEDEVLFERVWLIFVTLYRLSGWRTGSEYARKKCLIVLDSLIPELQFFIRAMTCGELNFPECSSLQPFSEARTPFLKTVEMLLFLLNTDDIDSALPHLQQNRYLLMSAFTWACRSGKARYDALMTLTVPDCEPECVMFYYSMTVLARPMRAWQAICDIPDYDFMLLLRPENIGEIQYRIINNVNALAKYRYRRSAHISKLCIEWRAWMVIFGVHEFVKILIGLLMWNTQSSADPFASRPAFKMAATLLVLCLDFDQDKIFDVLKTSLQQLDDGPDSVPDGGGLTHFCVVFMGFLKDRWDDVIEVVRNTQENLLSDEVHGGSPRLMFSLALVRAATEIPQLYEAISPDLFEVMITRHDWQTAVDLFISRALYLSRHE